MKEVINIYEQFKHNPINEKDLIYHFLKDRNFNNSIKKFIYIIMKFGKYNVKSINEYIYKVDNGLRNQSFYLNTVSGRIIINEKALFYLKKNKNSALPNRRILNRFYHAFSGNENVKFEVNKKQINRLFKNYNLVYSPKMHCLLNSDNYAKNNNYNNFLDLLSNIKDKIKSNEYSIRLLNKEKEHIIAVCDEQKIYVYFINKDDQSFECKEFHNKFNGGVKLNLNDEKIIFDNGLFNLKTKEEIYLKEPIFDNSDYIIADAEKFYLLYNNELLFFDLIERKRSNFINRFKKNYKLCINYDLNSILLNGKEYYMDLKKKKYKDVIKFLKKPDAIKELEKDTKFFKLYKNI